MSDEHNGLDFDCVGFKRRAQPEIYERIKDMTWEEEVEYFRRNAENGPFAAFLRRVREAQAERDAQRRASG